MPLARHILSAQAELKNAKKPSRCVKSIIKCIKFIHRNKEKNMCKKCKKRNPLTLLIRILLHPSFLYCIMFPIAFVYAGAIEMESNISEFIFPVLYVSTIPIFIDSLRTTYRRGCRFMTILEPFIFGAMLFSCFYVGNNLYAMLNHPTWKISDWMFVPFAFYWFVPATIGTILGLVCRIFKRK